MDFHEYKPGEMDGASTHGHPARNLNRLTEVHDALMIIISRAGDTPIKVHVFGGTSARSPSAHIVPCWWYRKRPIPIALHTLAPNGLLRNAVEPTHRTEGNERHMNLIRTAFAVLALLATGG
ncbi:MAG: hypothetical protein AAGH65_06235, partial [Pseudomonadota bacterium]